MSRTDYKIQDALDDFAYELGLRRGEDGHLSGVIENNKLPNNLMRDQNGGLFGKLDQRHVQYHELAQLRKQVNVWVQDLLAVCNHLGLYVQHNTTSVVGTEAPPKLAGTPHGEANQVQERLADAPGQSTDSAN